MSAIEIDNLLDVLQVKENAITTSDDTTDTSERVCRRGQIVP